MEYYKHTHSFISYVFFPSVIYYKYQQIDLTLKRARFTLQYFSFYYHMRSLSAVLCLTQTSSSIFTFYICARDAVYRGSPLLFFLLHICMYKHMYNSPSFDAMHSNSKFNSQIPICDYVYGMMRGIAMERKSKCVNIARNLK